MRSRLWSPKDLYQVLRYNKGTELIEGIKLDMSQIDNLRLNATVFEDMLNLRFILFYFAGSFWRKSRNKKLHADGDDSIFLPDELRYIWWESYPFKSLSGFNPKNLVVLKLPSGDMEHLWDEDDDKDLVNLREIHLANCKNLRNIPSLLGAINLKILCCNGCESLVELPCLSHLASLKTLELKKFPEVPNHFSILEWEETGIEEVPDSIVNLIKLEELCLRKSRVRNVSSNISKLESLRSLDLSHCLLEEVSLSFNHLSNPHFLDVPSRIVGFKSLQHVCMDHCNNLKLLLELPPYLLYLAAHECTTLEKVSFIDQNPYELDSLDSGDEFFMVFSNCFSLNQDSINNIEANAMLKIGSLAKKCAWKYDPHPPRLFCCFSGSEISANIFEYQSLSSSLISKIASNGCSGDRVLVFAICLVADLTDCIGGGNLECICEYQLTAADGGYEKFKSEWYCSPEFVSEREYKGDHVLIVFSDDMVKKDMDYQEASFEFYIKYVDFSGEEEDIKVEKCGVHVSYVDEETSPEPQHKRHRHT
ncbi:hypothetical protein V6N11_070788 [Hibiscus sabdariffa]|uniref:Uncharacterized protein n=1 Tax=Hibiscus sabdariffa TaxID=183260 RepID=A0ABR2QG39_9ROSI